MPILSYQVTGLDRIDNIEQQAVSASDLGSTAGLPLTHAFPFTYATAGLTSGVTIHVPTVGQILVDAWIEVTTAFNGTTPLADIGTFVGSTKGVFGNTVQPVDLSSVDTDGLGGGTGLLGEAVATGVVSSLAAVGVTGGFRVAPAKFVAVSPLKLVVSRTGHSGATAIGGSAGAGVVYFTVVTPLALA